MTAEERLLAACSWNAFVIFVALMYLSGGFLRSAGIAVFVLISCLLGLGRRWLFRGGLAVSMLAIAVILGVLPPPDQWHDLMRDARSYLMAAAH